MPLGTKSPFTSIGTLLSALLLVATLTESKAAVPKRPPNIVIFMIDDLGWNHISVKQTTMGNQRQECRTPELEKLAADGLSFTHAYAQPNCAPTRAAMLSGQYPARIHNDVYAVGNLNRHSGLAKNGISFQAPQQSEDVGPEAVTIAEALKKNGYATAHIGKYHVGGHRGKSTLPENAGFDINIGGYTQGHQPVCFAEEKGGSWRFAGLGRGDFDRYAAPYTSEYLEKNRFPAELAGTPKHIGDAMGDALETTITTLAGKGQPFYIQFHTYAVHLPVKSRPDLRKAAKESGASNPDYAGFVRGFDENMRRLRELLEDPNGDGDHADSISKDTLILFTSDNGGWLGGNAPLKGVKGMFTEGGIRVPLIACWPGVIRPGGVTDHMVHSVDYYATCLELAGKRWMPAAATHPLDGSSFATVLRDPAGAKPRGPIFYLFPGYLGKRAQPCAVVIDDLLGKRYKLSYDYETVSWELYCITDDLSESRNLIDSRRDVAAALSVKMHTWLTRQHPTWKPKYPFHKKSRKSAGPPPVLPPTP